MKNQTPISTKKFPFFHDAPTMYMDPRLPYRQRANDVPARALSLDLMWRTGPTLQEVGTYFEEGLATFFLPEDWDAVSNNADYIV